MLFDISLEEFVMFCVNIVPEIEKKVESQASYSDVYIIVNT